MSGDYVRGIMSGSPAVLYAAAVSDVETLHCITITLHYRV